MASFIDVVKLTEDVIWGLLFFQGYIDIADFFERLKAAALVYGIDRHSTTFDLLLTLLGEDIDLLYCATQHSLLAFSYRRSYI